MDKKTLNKAITEANRKKTKLKKELSLVKKAYVQRRKKNRKNYLLTREEKKKENFKADKAENNQHIYYHNRIKEEVFDPILKSDFDISWNVYR